MIAWPNRVVLFAAHPDDEVIGASSQFHRIRDLWIVHATDGAPANMRDAHAHGFSTREEYADARRKELVNALSIAGIEPWRALEIGFCDQETTRHLHQLTEAVTRLLRNLQPDAILAPAYEGGHPDHDSVAFAVHHAARITKIGSLTEYALYHNRAGNLHSGEFVAGSHPGETVLLDDAEKRLKARMLDCFVTQRETLSYFRRECESFRAAPDYDFAAPPHQGVLFYEMFDWGTTGAAWRKSAREATSALADD
jgi:LmbE family N-acetylglucosaminyl deacetylase